MRAVRGNNDSFDTGDPRFKDRHILELGGLKVGLIHILEPYDRPVDWLLDRYFGQRLDVVVFGDTHYEVVEEREGILFVNPGSATYPRNMERRLRSSPARVAGRWSPPVTELSPASDWRF